MIYSLYYTFTDDCDGINYTDYEYNISESIEDIKKYEYESTFGKKYCELSWYLQEGAKELIKDLDTKWFKNEIDTTGYYSFNFKFKDWLSDYYRADALKECLSSYNSSSIDNYYEIVSEFNE